MKSFEISLSDVIAFVIKNRMTYFFSVVFAIFTAVLLALITPNIYKSSILTIPSEDSQSGGLAALAGQFGGLASMAGINLGGDGKGKLTTAVETLKSKAFLTYVIEKYSWKADIVAAKDWKLESNQLIYDSSIFDEAQKKWVREIDLPFKPEPSLLETYELFVDNNFQVNENLENGTITISVRHFSPYIAEKMVNVIFQEINQYIREKEVAEAEKSIQFLSDKIESVQVAQVKSVFYDLIESQLQTVMLANVREEYFFKTIDPAIVPELPVSPNRIFMVILGGILGVILGVFISLLRLAYTLKATSNE